MSGPPVQPVLLALPALPGQPRRADAPDASARAKPFIDYSGGNVRVINAVTGEILRAQLFVGVMGASKHTHAEATWTQRLPDSRAEALASIDRSAMKSLPDRR